MNSGWVISINSEYRDIAEVLIEGLNCFSKYPVFVMTSGFGWQDSRFESRRVDGFESPNMAAFGKFRAVVESGFESCVAMDADTVPTQAVDDLMEISRSHKGIFPVLQRHIHQFLISDEILNLFKVEKPMDYGQSNMMIFPAGSICGVGNFASKVKDAMTRFGSLSLDATKEESAVNAYLWSLGVIDLVNYCTPRTSGFSEYESGYPDRIYPGSELTWQAWHGCKCPIRAREVLSKLMAEPESKRSRKPRLL